MVKGVIRHGELSTERAAGRSLSKLESPRRHRRTRPDALKSRRRCPTRGPPSKTIPESSSWTSGIKNSIVYKLEQANAEVIVVPAQTTPAQIMALNPYGLVIANGPGDPAGPKYAHDTVWQMLGLLLPTYGICSRTSTSRPCRRRHYLQAQARAPRGEYTG